MVGRISNGQDGVVVDAEGISPTHTAGHGNCPKVTEPLNPYQGGCQEQSRHNTNKVAERISCDKMDLEQQE